MLEFPLIQIAGVSSAQDAEIIILSGIKYIGFPLELAYHKEDLSKDQVGEIISTFPEHVKPVLITYLNQANDIFNLMHFIKADIVQIHSDIDIKELQKLRGLSPEISIIKSLIVKKNNFEELALQIKTQENVIDAFITDTFDPETGASGATGKIHDWNISAELVKISSRPIILAGGLTPDNVYAAVQQVKPAGVDSHTGVENVDGTKSKQKMEAFIRNATNSFNSKRCHSECSEAK